jgi:hypothetical protein
MTKSCALLNFDRLYVTTVLKINYLMQIYKEIRVQMFEYVEIIL